MISPQTLLKYPIFGGMEEEQIKKIIPLLKEDKLGPDEFIIIEGKPNDKIFFLIEGQVSVSRKDTLLTKFGEGEAFGEMEVLDVMPAVASIKSISNVTLMSISNKTLREIYKIDLKIFSLLIMNLARDLSRRLRKTDEKLADTSILI
jgi:CRP-like cAMP-binding protein